MSQENINSLINFLGNLKRTSKIYSLEDTLKGIKFKHPTTFNEFVIVFIQFLDELYATERTEIKQRLILK